MTDYKKWDKLAAELSDEADDNMLEPKNVSRLTPEEEAQVSQQIIDGVSYSVKATEDIIEDITVERTATVSDFVCSVRKEFFFDIHGLHYEQPNSNSHIDLTLPSFSQRKMIDVVPPGTCLKAINLGVDEVERIRKGTAGQVSEPTKPNHHAATSSTSPPSQELSRGNRVRIIGLKGRPEWNGMVGTLERWVEEKERWEVRLDTMQPKDSPLGLKPCNLEFVAHERAKIQTGFLKGGLRDERSKPRGAVIFLCGKGDSGESFRHKLSELSKGKLEEDLRTAGIKTVAFPYPRGADEVGTVSQREWLQPSSAASPKSSEDLSGICESLELVDGAIDQIIAGGIVPERIGIFGHGVGGCIALHLVFGQGRHAGKVGAAACARTFLTQDSILPQAAEARFQRGAVPSCPLFLSHGQKDDQVQAAWVDETRRRLGAAGIKVPHEVMNFCEATHDLCADELTKIVDFFVASLLKE